MNRTAAGGLTLEEAYVAFDMRESYLQRHASEMALQAEMTELQTKDFTTRSCNVWKSDDMSLYPEAGSCADEESDHEIDEPLDGTVSNIYEQKVSYS